MRNNGDLGLIYKAIDKFRKDCKEKGYEFRIPRPVCSSKRGNIIYLRDLQGKIARYRILSDGSLKMIPYKSQIKR